MTPRNPRGLNVSYRKPQWLITVDTEGPPYRSDELKVRVVPSHSFRLSEVMYDIVNQLRNDLCCPSTLLLLLNEEITTFLRIFDNEVFNGGPVPLGKFLRWYCELSVVV